MDTFGATLPMWDMECLLLILHFNLVANCAEKKIIQHPIINETKITCYTQNQRVLSKFLWC